MSDTLKATMEYSTGSSVSAAPVPSLNHKSFTGTAAQCACASETGSDLNQAMVRCDCVGPVAAQQPQDQELSIVRIEDLYDSIFLAGSRAQSASGADISNHSLPDLNSCGDLMLDLDISWRPVSAVECFLGALVTARNQASGLTSLPFQPEASLVMVNTHVCAAAAEQSAEAVCAEDVAECSAPVEPEAVADEADRDGAVFQCDEPDCTVIKASIKPAAESGTAEGEDVHEESDDCIILSAEVGCDGLGHEHAKQCSGAEAEHAEAAEADVDADADADAEAVAIQAESSTEAAQSAQPVELVASCESADLDVLVCGGECGMATELPEAAGADESHLMGMTEGIYRPEHLEGIFADLEGMDGASYLISSCSDDCFSDRPADEPWTDHDCLGLEELALSGGALVPALPEAQADTAGALILPEGLCHSTCSSTAALSSASCARYQADHHALFACSEKQGCPLLSAGMAPAAAVAHSHSEPVAQQSATGAAHSVSEARQDSGCAASVSRADFAPAFAPLAFTGSALHVQSGAAMARAEAVEEGGAVAAAHADHAMTCEAAEFEAKAAAVEPGASVAAHGCEDACEFAAVAAAGAHSKADPVAAPAAAPAIGRLHAELHWHGHGRNASGSGSTVSHFWAGLVRTCDQVLELAAHAGFNTSPLRQRLSRWGGAGREQRARR